MSLRSFLLIAWCFVLYNTAVAQSPIDDLNAQRSILIQNGESTENVDMQLYHLGYLPKAIVHQNSSVQIEFPFYHPISTDKATRVQQRLTAYYPFLTEIEVLVPEKKIRASFTQVPTAEMINEIVSHFSYSGYEIH